MRGNPIPKDPGSVRGQFFHLSIGAILPVFLDDTVEPMAQGTKSRHTKPTGWDAAVETPESWWLVKVLKTQKGILARLTPGFTPHQC